MASARLEGKVALITGAAGAGIGSATARRLAADGATIVVTDIHERRTNEVTQALQAAGATAIGVPMDVADRAAVDRVVAAVLDQLGSIDILVNNAAINVLAEVHEMDPADWDRIIDVNLTGPWYLIRAVLPNMMERRRGWIVNVTSVAGYLHAGREGPYAATKAGLHSLTRSVASEMGPFGIRCNAVAPAITESKWLDKNRERMMPNIERTPLRRFGRAEDIANAIAFLISDESSFITGEAIAVSGGWYMRA